MDIINRFLFFVINWINSLLYSPERTIKAITYISVAAIVLPLLVKGIRLTYVKKKIYKLANSSLQFTPQEFMRLRTVRDGRRYVSSSYDFPGVYILLNRTKNMSYVGQATKVFQRVNQHFQGRANGDVYADYKYGDDFVIKMIALRDSGFASLDKLERQTIQAYNAYYKGYNKTRGNR